MPVWSDPGRSKSEMVRRLHGWWTGNASGSDVPDRGALGPEDLKPLLPYLFVCDAEHDPFRVRYRLVGTRAVEVTGVDITGRYLDELLSAEPDQPWLDHYRSAYESRRPVLGATTLPTSAGRLFTYEFGIFPVRRGGHTVDQFIAVEDYFGLVSRIMHVQPRRVADTPPPATPARAARAHLV